MEELTGHIESILYANPENSFTVAKLQSPKYDKLITLVGFFPSLLSGESISCQGEWTIHPQYGKQFEAKEHTIQPPSDIIGIQKYLESGLVKGIGPVYAKKIVDRFKEETLTIIDNSSHRLLEISGIGKKKVKQIKECWEGQRQIRQVMIFLRGHGVSPGYAQKIYKTYGNESIEKVKLAPYQLAKDIFGIGFKIADNIAQNLGHSKTCEERIEAGIEHILWELSNEGNTCYPKEGLIAKVGELLEIAASLVEEKLKHLINKNELIEDRYIFLKSLYTYEQSIAQQIHRLLSTPVSFRQIDVRKAVDWAEHQLHLSLALQQKVAVEHALQEKMHIVTGGPGTGKSTITNVILTILGKLTNKILLAAPTGRAAKRLIEITKKRSVTIHSLLEFDFVTGLFKRNENNPLICDLLIIDEASMIDTFLMASLLQAVPSHARILFIGDIDQLPSVGAGNVLKDMIASCKISTTRLIEIFRQGIGSRIVLNAHRINQGKFPDLSYQPTSDFRYYPFEEPSTIQQKILQLVKEELPKEKHFDPMKDIQVLSPMKKGAIGIEMLNHLLQQTLNPSIHPFYRGGRTFHVGDKVMQIRNNYNKKVFNGDIGKIIDIDSKEEKMLIDYEEKIVSYEFSELDEIVLAYAVSVHKYQGSESPCIVLPIHTSHFKLLYRNLLYTAITRGKKLVVLVGTKKSIAIAIKNEEVNTRYTGLQKTLINRFLFKNS